MRGRHVCALYAIRARAVYAPICVCATGSVARVTKMTVATVNARAFMVAGRMLMAIVGLRAAARKYFDAGHTVIKCIAKVASAAIGGHSFVSACPVAAWCRQTVVNIVANNTVTFETIGASTADEGGVEANGIRRDIGACHSISTWAWRATVRVGTFGAAARIPVAASAAVLTRPFMVANRICIAVVGFSGVAVEYFSTGLAVVEDVAGIARTIV